MTVQMKRFIELADIIGLRLQCNACRCSLSLGNSEKEETVDNILSKAHALMRCPVCGIEWEKDNRFAGGDSEIKQFFRVLRELRTLEKTFGCSLRLEITGVDKQ